MDYSSVLITSEKFHSALIKNGVLNNFNGYLICKPDNESDYEYKLYHYEKGINTFLEVEAGDLDDCFEAYIDSYKEMIEVDNNDDVYDYEF